MHVVDKCILIVSRKGSDIKKTYKIRLLVLDMSKAFDIVKKAELFRDLKEILHDDELHVMMIMLKDVVLKVRVGKETGKNGKI